jgi:hypothetical protein
MFNIVLVLACIYGMWNMQHNMYSINKYNLPIDSMEEVFAQADAEGIDEVFFNVLKLEQIKETAMLFQMDYFDQQPPNVEHHTTEMMEMINLKYNKENVMKIRTDILLKKNMTKEQMAKMSSGPSKYIQYIVITFAIAVILKFMMT